MEITQLDQFAMISAKEARLVASFFFALKIAYKSTVTENTDKYGKTS